MAIAPQWQSVTPNFRGSSMTMASAQRGINSAVDTIGKMQDRAMRQKAHEDALLQQDIQNKRADAGLLLQQNADTRAEDILARNVGKDRAAQVGMEETNLALVDPNAYKEKLLAAQQQQTTTDQVLNSYDLDTPEGEEAFLADSNVDNTSLLNRMQKANMSKINKQEVENNQNYSNKILTNIAAMPYGQRANAVKSLQEDPSFLPDTNTAKTMAALLTPPETKEVTGTVTIGKDGKYTNIPISQLGRYKQEGWTEGKPFKGSNDSSESSKLYSTSPEAKSLDLDFFGTGDRDRVVNVGQKLQDTFGFNVKEVDAIMELSTSGFIDKSLSKSKLESAIKNAGVVKNQYYIDEKDGKTKALTAEKVAEGLLNEDIEIRTNADGTRVFVDNRKEKEKLKKYNDKILNPSRPPKTVTSEDNKVTLPVTMPSLLP